ncbi:MAG: hypothetical protein Tsb0016_24270 [Sphingomonadales bacterium]
MSGRGLKILGLVTLAAMLVAAVLLWREAARDRPAQFVTGAMLPDLATRLDAVDGLQLAKGAERLALARREAGWLIVSAADAPAKIAPLRQLLVDLAKIEKLEPRSDDPALYPRLGLGEDALIITIYLGAEEHKLYLGKAAGGGIGRRYARLDDDPRAWLVDGAVDPEFNISHWADLGLPTMARQQVRRLVIRHPDGGELEIGRDTPDQSDFEIRGLAADEAPIYPSVGNGIAAALAQLSYDGLRRRHGFDFEDAVTVRFEAWDDRAVSLRLIAAEEKWWATPLDAGAASGWAFRLADHDAEDLTKRRADLVMPHAQD